LKYAVVGLGNIGRKRRELLGIRCTATVDPYAADADYAVLEDCPPAIYDAVILAVPNQAKPVLIEQAISQGKHVLVEKWLPLADRASAGRLEALARARGVRCYTSYNHRFEPLVMQLRDMLAGGAIGAPYYGRLFYGNGTVSHVAGSWRDAGLGVVEDLGSHLLDLSTYLFNERAGFTPCLLDAHEAVAYDHCALVSSGSGPRLVLEASYLSWKNTFTIDVLGRDGSLHVRGLRKWGESELVLRERVRPSGLPPEWRWVQSGPDTTWQQDLSYFETLCQSGPGTSVEQDWWIADTLRKLMGVHGHSPADEIVMYA
jgi:predicted dehydrogenase